MCIRKESDLKKLVDTFGKQLATGYIEIHEKKGNLFAVRDNSVSIITKFKEGYLVREFPFSDKKRRTNPIHTELIDKAHNQYEFAKNLYEDSIRTFNPYAKNN